MSQRTRCPSPAWLGEATAAVVHDVGNSLLALSFLVSELEPGPQISDWRSRLNDTSATIERASSAIALLGRLCAESTQPERLDLRAIVAATTPFLRVVAWRSLEVTAPTDPVFVCAARAGVERTLFEFASVAGRAAAVAARLALDPARDGTTRIALEFEPPLARDAVLRHAAAFPCARALADSCGGRFTIAELENGALLVAVAFDIAS
jgi:hypothetical protein